MRVLGWEPEDEIFRPDADDEEVSLFGLIPDTRKFQSVRVSENDMWALLRHQPTGHTRWIFIDSLHETVIEEVFFDADPTFLPSGERN